MIVGQINKMKMLRKSDLGFNLSDGKDEVLLHYKESTRELNPNDEVLVFVYYDKAGRTAATMHEPKMTIDKCGFTEVVDVTDYGVYVSNGSAKDVLVSKDYLPYNKAGWPIVGDVLCTILKIKNNKMLAKPINRDELREYGNDVNYALKEIVDGYVARISDGGLGVITKDLEYIFVPAKQIRGSYRLGMEVKVHILSKSDNGYYGSLLEQKEKLVDEDSIAILDYLKKHNGKMSLTAKSDADSVFKELRMSRKAFKRALGSLYKERKVDCKETETILMDNE